MIAEKHNPGLFGLIPKLVQDYLNNDSTVLQWTKGNQSEPGWIDRMNHRGFSDEKRAVLRDHLVDSYNHWGLLNASRKQYIDQLLDKNTFTVTTGHQMNLFLGPAYFVYKILHTIILADHVSKETGRQVLPIYWMASEDHDWEEINHTWWFNVKAEWKEIQKGGALGRVGLSGMDEVLNGLKEELRLEELPFESLLSESIRQEDSLADFTAKLVHLIFPNAPILVLNSDNRSLKSLFHEVMKLEIVDSFSQSVVESRSSELEASGYHAQIHARDVNLFWIGDDQRRRITKENGEIFTSDKSIQWSEYQLLDILKKTPDYFSPNVVLRPVYQECILPNLAYIGGPSEVSYWMQLKAVFEKIEVPFPQLIMRNQALILHKKDAERMEQLGVSLGDLFEREDGLLSRWNKEQSDVDFTEAEKKLEQIIASLQKQVPDNDGLQNMLSAQQTKWGKDLDYLENRIAKANKTKHEKSLRQLKKLRNKVFPNGTFQERNQNFFSFQVMYPDVLEHLQAGFDPMGAQLLVLYLD